ncbi:hypothetical protein PR202_gb29331 [Eleusine coracana subsp. coracana]|uniref:BHLH domain-containing protein n=1 Tax=Eleusine coracana subsp. coracana TaxID=191504 RepID=A0AAV5FWT5_ELECO|nr:hypothetical protein PR202_gb29331 [Eleusine coracana subsp. coracana]
MAHDGFLGAFTHELPWQLAHAAAAGAPFHGLQVGGASMWDHDAAMSSPPVPSHEAVLMEQLASQLGVGAPSPPYPSCYSSPSKPMNAKLSCFGAAACVGGKLSRVASSQSLLAEPAASPRYGSSSDGPSRKRKSTSKAKEAVAAATTTKVLQIVSVLPLCHPVLLPPMPTQFVSKWSPNFVQSPEPERRAKKRSKLSVDSSEDDETKPVAGGDAGQDNGKGKELVVAEPPKDYIHVRARRGQATDSHSLAERVRREKISERMKLLQDIVPGCSKVTGKAVMLDEIINYVQSLQRQVEFLSMKLSTVNPRLDVMDEDSFIQKDANQPCVHAPTTVPSPAPPVYSMEHSNSPFCYASSPAPVVHGAVTNTKSFEGTSSFVSHGMPDHQSLEGFQNANPQIQSPWEDDLQSLVQMGFRGNT